MLAPLAAVALLAVLSADVPPAPPAARLLPRSSIAAVLARRGELGLGDAQVKQLEEREAALQRQLGEIRQGSGARPPGGPGQPEGRADRGGAGSRPGDDHAPASEARGGQGRGGGRHGSRGAGRAAPADSPAARSAELQQRLDDADTAAWVAAEELLPEAQREPARAVAERYREALADQREAERRGK